MQGSARRDTSALASALALTARTFIVCPCCEDRGTLCWRTGEGIRAASDETRTHIRFFGGVLCLRSGTFRLAKDGRIPQARGTRKVEGCAGRRSRPAPGAEAKRTPEQPGRGRRDDPRYFSLEHWVRRVLESPARPVHLINRSTQ